MNILYILVSGVYCDRLLFYGVKTFLIIKTVDENNVILQYDKYIIITLLLLPCIVYFSLQRHYQCKTLLSPPSRKERALLQDWCGFMKQKSRFESNAPKRVNKT